MPVKRLAAAQVASRIDHFRLPEERVMVSSPYSDRAGGFGAPVAIVAESGVDDIAALAQLLDKPSAVVYLTKCGLSSNLKPAGAVAATALLGFAGLSIISPHLRADSSEIQSLPA
jgi:hypothetical protein